MMKALKIAALCAVGAMAAEQAEVTYYNSTQCNSGQISTVNVNPNSCQINSEGSSYYVRCNLQGQPNALFTCTDGACQQCTQTVFNNNGDCIGIGGAGGISPARSAKVTCPKSSSAGKAAIAALAFAATVFSAATMIL